MSSCRKVFIVFILVGMLRGIFISGTACAIRDTSTYFSVEVTANWNTYYGKVDPAIGLQDGDSVGVFDAVGNCYGAGLVKNGYYYLSAFKEEKADAGPEKPNDFGIPGFEDGEIMIFKAYKQSTGEILALMPQSGIEQTYEYRGKLPAQEVNLVLNETGAVPTVTEEDNGGSSVASSTGGGGGTVGAGSLNLPQSFGDAGDKDMSKAEEETKEVVPPVSASGEEIPAVKPEEALFVEEDMDFLPDTFEEYEMPYESESIAEKRRPRTMARAARSPRRITRPRTEIPKKTVLAKVEAEQKKVSEKQPESDIKATGVEGGKRRIPFVLILMVCGVGIALIILLTRLLKR